MDIRVITDTIHKDEVNSAARHPLQTWEWGEARKETGLEVMRIGEYEQDQLRNVFQMTIHPIPHSPWSIGYLPRSVMPSLETFNFLKLVGKEKNLIFIKLEPYIKKTDEIKVPDILTSSPHPLFPKWTQMLDISKDEEELLKQLKSKTRYNIRLAEKKGVIVKEESTEEGFEKFSKLYFDTTKRQKYFGHTKKYHEIVWKHMKEGLAHILIAYYNNIPLSAYELFYFKNTLYYPYGGSSDKHREVMASNLIMWEAIKLGKKLGAINFDMWGSLPEDYDRSAPWSGFTRFKEGYGTTFVEFIGSYDLVLNAPLYYFYNVAHTVRSTLLKVTS